MASGKVSVLKFVGTISLGLLTGTSYTLSTLTIPSLLELPSASAAAKAFRSLSSTASFHIDTLSAVSGTAFLLAYKLSHRGFKHPYLLYVSVFCFATRLTDYVTPSIFGKPVSSTSAAAHRRAELNRARKEKQAAKRMEASYELLGEAHSDEDTSANGEEFEEDYNGEEVRSEVEFFVRNKLIQTAVSGIGFLMAVTGIWGDGLPPVVFTV
ncbi:uncharacterized protein F4807DRAFT_429805 [Annulohypoxylon truncatum]|uniref:uncharacterized protein n=1 Tax=Annulohypoxylon truncatum TaxID=327061 RepID=UPI002007473D|nr:uncharacterized protein F4807DRAFT_429805 [Annulohypoxylon truncatum]KAI1208875.1 hypothetical protein F4807DRAFT_429805 [Annulohypoxylon truncatum]